MTLAALAGIDPNAPKPSQEALDAALENSLRAIEDGERDTARDHWDPKFVVAGVGSDPQRLFEWVQQNTFWVPYHGLLRGTTGVLMDRLGNSLDRAGLLAILLRQAGRTSRLAHASLSVEQALDLLEALHLARYAEVPPAGNAIADLLPAIASKYQLDEASLRRTRAAQADFATRTHDQLVGRVPGGTERLIAAVGSRPGDLQWATLQKSIDAMRDHWWVQVREGSEWQDFDVVSPSVGTALAAPDRTIDLDAFPSDLRHQVTIRVVAEQWTGSALAEHVALQKELRLSQLVGTPIVLRFMPEKFPAKFPDANKSPDETLRSFALAQHSWTPALIVGTETAIQWVIRETGDLISTSEARKASGGMAGGAMAGLTERLNEALGSSTPPSPAPTKPAGALTATWIEYEIQRPGEPSQKIRRALFDLIGPAARAKKASGNPQLDDIGKLTRSLALFSETEILPVVCRFTPEYLTHLGAQNLLANRAVLRDIMRDKIPDDVSSARSLANRLAAAPTPLYGLALARFTWSRFSDQIFIDQPNILTRHSFFAPSGEKIKLVGATDIVANGIGVDWTADPFAVRVEQGVLDTNAESIQWSARPHNLNAGAAFAAGGDWAVLRGAGDARLASLGLSDDVRQRISDDLSAGYLVVAPTSPVPVGGESFSGWWRVNPATGDTLGMGASGRGEEMLEYLITQALTSALLWFLLEFLACTLMSATPIAEQGPGCVGKAVWAAVVAFFMTLFASALFIYLGGGGGVGAFAKTLPGKPGVPGAGGGAPPGGGLPGAGGGAPPGGGLPGAGGGAPPGGGAPGPGGGLPGSGGGGIPGAKSPVEGLSPELKQAFQEMQELDSKMVKMIKSSTGKLGNKPEYQELLQQQIDAFNKWMKLKGAAGSGGGVPPAGQTTQGGINGVLNALGGKSGG